MLKKLLVVEHYQKREVFVEKNQPRLGLWLGNFMRNPAFGDISSRKPNVKTPLVKSWGDLS
jgi:hypothetical protein